MGIIIVHPTGIMAINRHDKSINTRRRIPTMPAESDRIRRRRRLMKSLALCVRKSVGRSGGAHFFFFFFSVISPGHVCLIPRFKRFPRGGEGGHNRRYFALTVLQYLKSQISSGFYVQPVRWNFQHFHLIRIICMNPMLVYDVYQSRSRRKNLLLRASLRCLFIVTESYK